MVGEGGAQQRLPGLIAAQLAQSAGGRCAHAPLGIALEHADQQMGAAGSGTRSGSRAHVGIVVGQQARDVGDRQPARECGHLATDKVRRVVQRGTDSRCRSGAETSDRTHRPASDVGAFVGDAHRGRARGHPIRAELGQCVKCGGAHRRVRVAHRRGQRRQRLPVAQHPERPGRPTALRRPAVAAQPCLGHPCGVAIPNRTQSRGHVLDQRGVATPQQVLQRADVFAPWVRDQALESAAGDIDARIRDGLEHDLARRMLVELTQPGHGVGVRPSAHRPSTRRGLMATPAAGAARRCVSESLAEPRQPTTQRGHSSSTIDSGS
ncbi:MAG: hypothetical protein R2736_17085 [Solirubrobacterales bacterium]